MNAHDVLVRAANNKVQLWREGDLLRYHGAAPDVDPLLSDLARFKPRLLEMLAQPDAREFASAVEGATRFQWLTPQPCVLTHWKRFNAHFGTNLTSQQIGEITHFIFAHPQLDNTELLHEIGVLLRQKETA